VVVLTLQSKIGVLKSVIPCPILNRKKKLLARGLMLHPPEKS
jgi:hypothetical protein